MDDQSKQLYSQLCEAKYIPIHGQPWWLDVVCGAENWDVVLAFDRHENIIGAMPFTKSRRLGIEMIRMPILTSYLPIFLDYPASEKRHYKYGFENKTLTRLITQLPNATLFDQNYYPGFVNRLPFYWNGFKQTTRFTYLLDDLNDLSAVNREMESTVRGKIRKAQNADIRIVENEFDLSEFYGLVQMTFHNQNQKPPFSFEVLNELDMVLKSKKQRKIYFAKDKNGNIHAAGYVIWDEKRAYYLSSGTNPEFRKSGAHYLLIWTAIKDCAKLVKSFDFEGSMLPQVESVFRSFGATRMPYIRVYTIRNRFLRAILAFLGKN